MTTEFEDYRARVMRCRKCDRMDGIVDKDRMSCVLIAECGLLPTTCPWDRRKAEWKIDSPAPG